MAISSPAATQFVLDVKGLDGLKRAAAKDPRAQIKAAATQFEALFLGRMLKSMRTAGIKSNLLDHRDIDFYQSLLDQQLAQNMAGKGLGEAQMLIRQLSSRTQARAGAVAAAQVGAIPTGTPASLADAPPIADAQASVDAAVTDAVPDGLAGTLMRAIANARAVLADRPGNPPGAIEDTAAAPGQFVDRFMGAARSAAQKSGVPALLIMAQAALETGWGQHKMTTASGGDSHNLFGIKAGAGWNGATADATTREFGAGRWTQVREVFRAYGSDLESFLDHAKLLGSSPRYAAVRDAASPEAAARALQDCGYATDPGYANKLIAVMHQIGDLAAR